MDSELEQIAEEPAARAGPSEPSAEAAPANARLPFSFVRRHGVLESGREQDCARLLVRPGLRLAVLGEVRRRLGLPLHIERVDSSHFEVEMQRAYESDSSEASLIAGDMEEDMDLENLASLVPETEDLLESADDAPIIRLINALLTQAIREDASDVHIETFEDRMVVRLRVDGVLREILEPRRVLAPLLVSRIKVMAKLDIAEKRLPQDGRISLKVAGRAVDVRVSTLPSGHGERVVLRLLDKQAGRLDLAHLGMDTERQALMDQIVHRPHGIVLVTGPTGSGKTTTLYAVLSRLNDSSRNIMTVEDPIEYYLDGIGQTNVNTKVDMTFARGLRAILRQDPDVVMVGEIRDRETAEIGIQASLTGHMMLSTLHTNTAIGAIARLRDMGIEPFLLASSLIGLLAQRLVRRLCNDCRQAYQPGEAEMQRLGIDPQQGLPTLYKAEGCQKCNFQGYRGRLGIFELIELDDTVRRMIHNGEGEQAIEAYVRQSVPSMREDGINRVLAGETTVDELLRVTRDG